MAGKENVLVYTSEKDAFANWTMLLSAVHICWHTKTWTFM